MSDFPETERGSFVVAGAKKPIHPFAKSRPARFVGAGCGGLFLSLLLFACAVFLIGRDVSKKPSEAAYFLHSSAPFHAVRIPFKLRRGAIMLPGELSGKKMECELDTGCPEIIWDASLHLAGKPTGQTVRGTDATGKNSHLTEVVLPLVRFGDYEVRNHPTKTVEPQANRYSMLDKAVRRAPLIGNEVFRSVVVTIDYRAKELIVRAPDYDFSRQPLENGAAVVPFVRLSPAKERLYGLVAVEGEINGVPARIVPDTGCLVGVWMKKGLANKIERHAKQKLKTIPTNATDLQGNAVNVYRGGIKLGKNAKRISDARIVVHPKVDGFDGIDAFAGNQVLQFFRVTVDYPRQKMLLEPYTRP